MAGQQTIAETLGELNSGGCVKYFLGNTFGILSEIVDEQLSQEPGFLIIRFLIGPGITWI